MAVPAGVVRRLVGPSEPVDLDQPNSALHQAAGKQHTLAERSLSVELPAGLGLILEAKCPPGLRGAQQIERPGRRSSNAPAGDLFSSLSKLRR